MPPLALRANTLEPQDTLYWFADGGLLGKSTPAMALGWTPAAPGRVTLSVVDQAGRADSRVVAIEFAS